MRQQIPLNPNCVITTADEAGAIEAANDLAGLRVTIVNVAFYGARPGRDREWVLIDAGVAGTARSIQSAAERRFGAARPSAIVLTHAHFDHVGALAQLAEQWECPIFAHPLELPYLNGTQSYPPPDPSVGGGLMSTLSRFYPRGPIDVRGSLADLPADGAIPGMPEWVWIPTPGHTAGHISLWRERDRSLIAGDAFITTNQESAFGVLLQKPELHGPPMYYTTDWTTAQESVRRLADLNPEVAITGHGPSVRGGELRRGLRALADNFIQIAVPPQGVYVERPPVQ